MLSNNIAVSNEIPGSFWRPDSYMEKVPTAHILGYTPAASVNISEIGHKMAEKLHNISADYIKSDHKIGNKTNENSGQHVDILL